MTSSMPRSAMPLAAGLAVEVLGTVNEAALTAINLTGNEFDNYVTGNAGANLLDGAGGVDQLWGRGGDDTYYVDDRRRGGRICRPGPATCVYARSSVMLTAGMEVEVLATINESATTAINLTGNRVAQPHHRQCGREHARRRRRLGYCFRAAGATTAISPTATTSSSRMPARATTSSMPARATPWAPACRSRCWRRSTRPPSPRST